VFKLSLIQMRVEGGLKEQNLKRAERLVDEAARGGAAVVLLPEVMDLGWTHPSARKEAGEIPNGETCSRLRSLAQEHHIFLCAGLAEHAGKFVFNSAVLVDPDGRVLLHHRKLNELDIAHDCYARGDRLGVAQTLLGTFGLMICADGFTPGQVVSRTLGLMGAQIILSPCAWAVPADHDNVREPYGKLWLDNYGPVARDFGLWIAGCSNVGSLTEGPWKGRKCIGCSLVMGPDGKQVLMGPYGAEAEAILSIEIKLERCSRS
jgi:predicted amidohydrolase